MYKFIFVISLVISIALSAKLPNARRKSSVNVDQEDLEEHQEHQEMIAILRSVSDVEADGSYTFSFEGADGTAREERGIVINPGSEDSYVSVSGTYKYIDADGQTVDVHYTADENGFIPEGGNIPSTISKAARAGIISS